MNWWLFLGGTCLMMVAVLIDQWGTKKHAAALYLLGFALFCAAIFTS